MHWFTMTMALIGTATVAVLTMRLIDRLERPQKRGRR